MESKIQAKKTSNLAKVAPSEEGSNSRALKSGEFRVTNLNSDPEMVDNSLKKIERTSSETQPLNQQSPSNNYLHSPSCSRGLLIPNAKKSTDVASSSEEFKLNSSPKGESGNKRNFDLINLDNSLPSNPELRL